MALAAQLYYSNKQPLCLDKGYGNPTSRDAVDKHKYIPHICRIGEEKFDEQKQKRYSARRWVVERTIALTLKVQSNLGARLT
jgi:hypothetical protein